MFALCSDATMLLSTPLSSSALTSAFFDQQSPNFDQNNKDHNQEDPNYIRSQFTEDNPSSWQSTSQKNCGYMYDTRDTLDATSQYLQDGTYYRTRYAYPW